MLIRRLVLRHWCQHADAEFVFTEGMNSIVGQNGSGKSNLLEALRFCLALETGNPGKATDNIQDGHERASLCLEFEHRGRPGSISIQLTRNYDKNWEELSLEQEAARSLLAAQQLDARIDIPDSQRRLATFVPRETTKIQIVYADETITKVGDAKAWMRAQLGVDPKIISDNYFPRQGDVDGALSADKETRQRVFSEKAGTALCQTIWTELGKEERGIPEYGGVADRLLELQAREARLTGELQSWVERLAAARAAAPDVSAAKAILADHAKHQELGRSIAALQARRQPVAARVSNLSGELETLLALGLAARKRWDDGQPAAAAADQLLAARTAHAQQVETRRQAVRSVEQADGAVATHQAGQPADPDPAHTLVSLEAEIARSETSQSQLQQYLETFETGQCPTCEQPVQDAVVRCQQYRDQLPKLRAHLAELRALRHAKQVWTQKRAVYDARLSQLLHEQRTAQAALASAPEPAACPTAEQLTWAAETKVLAQNLQAELESLRSRYEACEADKNTQQAVLAELDQQLDQLAVAAGHHYVAEQIREAEELIARSELEATKLKDLEMEVEVRRRHLETVRDDLRSAETLARQAAPAEAWRKLLSEARDLLHRDALPAEVVAWYAEELVRHTMTYLTMFDSEFSLMVTSDLSLLALFPDKSMPVSRLSGGQKNMLNISMRLAMADLFPSDLQLLALDEVEVHLDQRNVAKLPAVLEKVKGLARGKHLCVLFISHHPALSGIADHVIRVGSA